MIRIVRSDGCPLFFQQGTGNRLEHSLTTAGFLQLRFYRFQVSLHHPSGIIAVMAAFAGGPVDLACQKLADKTREEAHLEYLKPIAHYQVTGGYEIPGEFLIAGGQINKTLISSFRESLQFSATLEGANSSKTHKRGGGSGCSNYLWRVSSAHSPFLRHFGW